MTPHSTFSTMQRYKDKKIMMVCYPSYGGSGVVATELGKELAQRGCQVHFVSYDIPVRLFDFHPNIFFHEVKPLEYDLFKFPMYEGALVSAIIDIAVHQQIDIIHTHYAIPHAYTALLAKQAIASQHQKNVKLVTTLHGTDITIVGHHKAYKSLVEYAINACDEVSSVSEFLKQETLRLFNIKRDIQVIYNFVDQQLDTSNDDKKEAELYKKMVCQEGDKVITHISNFRQVKRIKDVISVFYEVTRSFPHLTLLMVGDGPERYDAEKQCRELQICNKVKFIGKVEQVGTILSMTDIFILPSENESFGLSALEAMSFGVPVIGTSIGGIPEVVMHNESGFLHPLGDIKAMSESVLRLLTDEALWKKFSVAARARSAIFSKSSMVDRYADMYGL